MISYLLICSDVFLDIRPISWQVGWRLDVINLVSLFSPFVGGILSCFDLDYHVEVVVFNSLSGCSVIKLNLSWTQPGDTWRFWHVASNNLVNKIGTGEKMFFREFLDSLERWSSWSIFLLHNIFILIFILVYRGQRYLFIIFVLLVSLLILVEGNVLSDLVLRG